jgi:hypothetical protein
MERLCAEDLENFLVKQCIIWKVYLQDTGVFLGQFSSLLWIHFLETGARDLERLGSEKSLTPVFSIAFTHLFGPY